MCISSTYKLWIHLSCWSRFKRTKNHFNRSIGTNIFYYFANSIWVPYARAANGKWSTKNRKMPLKPFACAQLSRILIYYWQLGNSNSNEYKTHSIELCWSDNNKKENIHAHTHNNNINRLCNDIVRISIHISIFYGPKCSRYANISYIFCSQKALFK